jgi:hypothetical protein
LSRLSPATADSIFDVPWRIIDRVLEQHPRSRGTRIYSAPRRFDLATVFVVTTAYCLLFAAMGAMGASGVVTLVIAGFITLVGIGQAVLYGGQRPRKASVVVGIGLTWIGCAMPLVLSGARMIGNGMILGTVLYAATYGSALGALLGYLAGTVVAGVFLVTDRVRQRFWPTPETQAEEPTAAKGR